MAELEQLQVFTLQVQPLTGAMVDMDKRHMLEIQQRDLQLAEMRGTLTALNTRGSRLGPGKSELLDPKVLYKVHHRGRQIAYLIYEYFRVTGAHESVENYADLLTISLRNDDIQEFDSEWDGILLSMTKIPPDDILEGLYKLRIRESDKLKTVLELYDLQIHQKKLGPDCHRLKTMVKRSTEQDIRNKNFGARNGTFEKNAVVKNQGTKQRVQKILGDCWE